MRGIAWIFVLLLFGPSSFAASKQEETPDREMLKLMELLRDWDMIKNLDLMRQMEQLERTGDSSAEPEPRSSRREKTKDKQK